MNYFFFFFFTTGQGLKIKSRVNVDIYMNEGQDSEMSNTVHIVKHYEVRQGWVFIFCCTDEQNTSIHVLKQ